MPRYCQETLESGGPTTAPPIEGNLSDGIRCKVIEEKNGEGQTLEEFVLKQDTH